MLVESIRERPCDFRKVYSVSRSNFAYSKCLLPLVSNEIAAQVLRVGVHAIAGVIEGEEDCTGTRRHGLEAELREDRNPYVIWSVHAHRKRIVTV